MRRSVVPGTGAVGMLGLRRKFFELRQPLTKLLTLKIALDHRYLEVFDDLLWRSTQEIRVAKALTLHLDVLRQSIDLLTDSRYFDRRVYCLLVDDF